MTLFLYPIDQAVARSTSRVPRTSPAAVIIVLVEVFVLVLVAAISVIAMVFGLGFLVLTNSAMGPTMPVGSLVITQSAPASSLSTGDVVVLSGADGSGMITSRVTDVQASTGLSTSGSAQRLLTVRQDTAAETGTLAYEVTTAQRVLVAVPELGTVVLTAAQPAALAFVVLVALGLALQVTPSRRRKSAAIQSRPAFGRHANAHLGRNGHGHTPHPAH